ncbi:hypothetical protein KCV87_08605 [Actinosynnema pretiosum subsp. pretiosum]|uniref:NAD(+)--protein-arginine ADP-ribosyltransferase n=1 Tax=Actinosynnema pretiosum subsp. pretiosum TaxID=103721 RepID=A0AA45R780_9PSEU|nr:hypothetical protein KCV87_08605 [Actinosynnema pretiosum subsp. pretiosum]
MTPDNSYADTVYTEPSGSVYPDPNATTGTIGAALGSSTLGSPTLGSPTPGSSPLGSPALGGSTPGSSPIGSAAQGESRSGSLSPASSAYAPEPAYPQQEEPEPFTTSFAGAALVVGQPSGVTASATHLARSLPVERGRTVVVVDVPPAEEAAFWPAVAVALQGRGPVRLVVSHAGSMRPTAPAQWLADQLQAEVVAPDGALAIVPGVVFVTGTGGGYGAWLRFLPGASPTPVGRRFPVPQWEAVDPNSPWPTGEVGISEPIPSGLWLRAQRVAFDPNSPEARAVLSLPCRDNVLTVVVGGPGQPPIPVEEVCRLIGGLPTAARTRVRLVWFGGEHAAQSVADQLGEPVALYTGLPVGMLRMGASVVAVNPQGQPTWRPYVTEVAYRPGSGPLVAAYRPPVHGLVERAPGVFDLGGGVVLEVVPSGLWVHDAEDGTTTEVRALPVDPEWARLTVGTPGRTTAGAVAVAGASLVERLEPEVRRLLKVVFCDPTPMPRPPVAEEPPEPSVPEVPVPLSVDGPLPAPVSPTWEEQSGEETVPPEHRSTEMERDALRRMMGERYGEHAAVACRHLAERPSDPEAFEAVVTDLAAVSAFLTQDHELLTEAFRTGRLGRLWPHAAGVVSGLRRLPVHQGVTVGWGEARRLRTGDLLTDAAVLSTVAGPSMPVDGRVEFVVWSTTGRRVTVVDSFGSVLQERVLFAPGTVFKVLAVVEPEETTPMQVMLQEVVGRSQDLPPGVLGTLERAAMALRAQARDRAGAR